jgi:hypothetical protein
MSYRKMMAALAGALVLAAVAGGAQAAPAGALKAANVENPSAVEKVHYRKYRRGYVYRYRPVYSYYYKPYRYYRPHYYYSYAPYYYRPYRYYRPHYYSYGPSFGFSIGFGRRHWW